MGVRRLGDALRRRRGEQGLSQKAAAAAWQFPYTTLSDIERGVDRTYRVTNISRLSPILGEDAWELLQGPDVPVVPITRDELDEVRRELSALAATVATLVALSQTRVAGLKGLDLTNGELAEVVAFAHFVLSRRIRN